ncbi:hypothetical protein CNYM01_12218 [Colletotrichum nymphaeae SA-01]|uniref:Carbohydrate-binding module family 19 protein n=1 Tax=Colletotrichum nymphaeae SA-01 TaxID=1460502 RepID=A0A135UV50_9PEZI|nr:hypothetical protein CNYM01_12218 [Colletotrichum nymphaeae SA-01]
MLPSLRIADVVLLLLITQTTQAGPLRRGERYFRREWNTTYSQSIAASSESLSPSSYGTSPFLVSQKQHSHELRELSSSVAPPVTQQDQDGTTPTPIFVTLDRSSTRSPAATTQPVDQSPSTSPAESTVQTQTIPTTTSAVFLPPMDSTISLPPQLTSGFKNVSSVVPGNTASASAIVSQSLTVTPHLGVSPGASSSASPGTPLQSSLSFSFPVPGGETSVAESTTIAVATPSSLASTTASAAPTTIPNPQPSPDTPSSLQTTPASSSTPSSTLQPQVTGTPNNQVPTIRTSTPAATATISPAVAANNLASAKTFNTLFASLTEQSACTAGQIACVKGNVGICGANGAFAIQSCGTGSSCFALPMTTTEGVIVGCYDPQVASQILGTPVSASASVPGSAATTTTAVPAPPPASSDLGYESTVTITPTVIATYTISVTAPGAPGTTTSAAQAPGFTTTVFVTQTMAPAPAPSSTAAEGEDPSTTSTSVRKTHTSTADEDTSKTAHSSTTKSTIVESSTAEPTTTKASSSTTKASTPATLTGTFTDTLIVNPIPTDAPSVAADAPSPITTPKPLSMPAIGAQQGVSVLTVFVTVTEKEKETVTVTVTRT